MSYYLANAHYIASMDYVPSNFMVRNKDFIYGCYVCCSMSVAIFDILLQKHFLLPWATCLLLDLVDSVGCLLVLTMFLLPLYFSVIEFLVESNL